jgi:hypothetical protein
MGLQLGSRPPVSAGWTSDEPRRDAPAVPLMICWWAELKSKLRFLRSQGYVLWAAEAAPFNLPPFWLLLAQCYGALGLSLVAAMLAAGGRLWTAAQFQAHCVDLQLST